MTMKAAVADIPLFYSSFTGFASTPVELATERSNRRQSEDADRIITTSMLMKEVLEAAGGRCLGRDLL